jgi:hypothetical protein
MYVSTTDNEKYVAVHVLLGQNNLNALQIVRMKSAILY